MLNFSNTEAVNFLPDEDARAWLAELLGKLSVRLGEPAAKARLLIDAPKPSNIDDLFDLMCGVQQEVGQSEVEFTLLELGQDEVPSSFRALGNSTGQLMHTLTNGSQFLTVANPMVYKVPEIALASVARELGRIAIAVAGGHEVKPADFEADAELAAIALGMGVWVANGSYIFENGCCGGGCGVNLKELRTGLSMPEACFATALDGQRKQMSRRSLAKHLESTQKAAFKKCWGAIAKGPELKQLSAGAATMALGQG